MKQKRILIAAVIAGLGWSAQGFADSEQDKAIERGQAHYLLFCANCHGVDADGQGPLVELLKVTPTDLRLLQGSAGEATVADRVLKAVAGRHPVGESGAHKMPVFSDNLEISTVIEIAEYLETVQQ